MDERKNQLKAIEDNTKKDEEVNNHQKTTNSSQSPSPSHGADKVNDVLDKKNDEDALDFEAEEGECNDTVTEEQSEAKVNKICLEIKKIISKYTFILGK